FIYYNNQNHHLITMTSETSSSTPDATVKQQEKSEASKDRITLRKKASLDQGTPQQDGAQRGGSLTELFSALTVSGKENTVNPIEAGNAILDENSDFSDMEDAEKVIPMPKPGIPEAPYFDGLDVEPFLRSMKSLAIRSGISGAQLASCLPSYCSPQIRNFIRDSYVFRLRNWKHLKEFMIETYKNKEINKFKIKDLDIIVNREWRYSSSFSLINEFKVVARELIKRNLISEDVAVSKISKVLPGSYIKAGLLAQGERSTTNMFISLEEAVKFTQKCFTLLEKGKEYNVSSEVTTTRQFYTSTDRPSDSKLCVYCDKTWHPRAECDLLKRDLESKKVKINSQNNISFFDGTPININYGKGGMEAQVNKEFSSNICTIEEGGFYNDWSEGNESISNFGEELKEADLEVLMAKRKVEVDLKRESKNTKLNSMYDNEIRKDNYNIIEKQELESFQNDKAPKQKNVKLGLPDLIQPKNSDLLEDTMNLTVPITIRQLIKTNPDYRKELLELIKPKRVPMDNQKGKEKEEIKTVSQINELIKSSKLIKTKGKICGYPVVFTFDTGSMLNLVNKDLLDKMREKGIILKSDPASYSLKGIYGNYVSTSREIPDCPIEIKSSHTKAHLVVTESDSFEVLLGMPWIRGVRLSSTIDKNGKADFTINSNVDDSQHTFEINMDDTAEVIKPQFGINNLSLMSEFGINPYDIMSEEQQKKHSLSVYKSVKKKVKPVSTQIPVGYSKSPGIADINDNFGDKIKEQPTDEEMNLLNINKDYLTIAEQQYMKQELIELKGVFSCKPAQMGKKIFLSVDASPIRTGAVLGQEDNEGRYASNKKGTKRCLFDA
ncbi:hypothetical protein AYI70_g5379, partial [Smittium culicis]